MSYCNNFSCCGISELAEIREDDSPEESLMEVDPWSQAIVIFSDIERYTHGNTLATLIRSAHLGMITMIPVVENPNTSNKLRVWVWRVDPRALEKWRRKHIATHSKVVK